MATREPRLLQYMNEAEEMPLPELAPVAQFIFLWTRIVTDLLQVEQALRPTQEEVWEAVMHQVLDELSEEWGLEL